MGVSELLPQGTVTLLLADVEGSTRLWETQPEEMNAAVKRLDEVLTEVIVTHDGVRPVEQGEGDSFVIAFSRASDAAAAALDLQRAPLAPLRLRIGIHTGEVRLRDEGNYAGPTINRTARLRDLAHGGQTVLSGAAESLVVDRLPDGAWLVDLGTHPLRDLPRPERVVQLCHPDLRVEFPPLRTSSEALAHGLPVHLTRFVGRGAQISEVHQLLTENRLVTLTGPGGVGKTRLSAQLAAQLAGEFGGAWFVDLAPITDPDLVPITVARVLGLHDQPGRSTTDTVVRHLGARRALLVLDNCEHLIEASAALVVVLTEACPRVRLLATSREPIRVPGEVSYRVPSLSLRDEAVEMFSFRARRVRPDFRLTEDNIAAVTEICERLDGMPLAIELAAARVRALTLAEIVDGLRDRFQLLTGGTARTLSQRQQTLWGSVDWSYTLLTEPERILFRRLAVFVGCFSSTTRERWLAAVMCRAIRFSTGSRCSSRSRWCWPTKPRVEPVTGCWRPCGNMPWKSSTRPARSTPCGRATATTTRDWPRFSTTRATPTMHSASMMPRPKSTTCAPHLCGAVKIPTPTWPWRWRPRCCPCG
ncbi:hypothetical protein LRC484719_42590 [Mycobacterium riyadhense]